MSLIHPNVSALVQSWGPGRFVFAHRGEQDQYLFRWIPAGCPREYPGFMVSITPEVFWGTA